MGSCQAMSTLEHRLQEVEAKLAGWVKVSLKTADFGGTPDCLKQSTYAQLKSNSGPHP